MSKISIIVAVSSNMVIGKDNDLPWNIPSDLKNFKKVTNGKTVIMGRKCWESIPEKFRPLPNRLNIVITNDTTYDAIGAKTVTDYDNLIKELQEDGLDDEVFIIGGAQLYKGAFFFADKVYLTKIYSDIEGDTFLEGFDENEWELIESTDIIEENGFEFNFQIYT